MTSSNEILKEIRDAAKRIGIAPTTLCQRAVKNAKLVSRLEEGESVTLATVERLRAFIAKAEAERVAS